MTGAGPSETIISTVPPGANSVPPAGFVVITIPSGISSLFS